MLLTVLKAFLIVKFGDNSGFIPLHSVPLFRPVLLGLLYVLLVLVDLAGSVTLLLFGFWLSVPASFGRDSQHPILIIEERLSDHLMGLNDGASMRGDLGPDISAFFGDWA